MVTLQNIAHEAGVSRVVVSCVLNGRDGPNVRVSDETRSRIHALVKKHGYQPNALVKALQTKKTHALGVLMPSVNFSFWACMLDAIEQAASERGWQVLMCQTHSDPKTLEAEVNMLRQRRVDGLLVMPHPRSGLFFNELLATGQKMVFIDDLVEGVSAACAKSDDVAGAKLAVEHLLSLGRRRVLFVGWPSQQTPNAASRRLGYEHALAARGLPSESGLILESPTCCLRDAFEMTCRLLASGVRFDAVFAVNDVVAIGVVEALRQAKLRIPQDVAVVGYGNLREGVFMAPTLTTVDQKPEESGRRAVEIILAAIEEGRMPEMKTVMAAPRLVVRDSCGGRKTPSEAEWLRFGW